MKRIFPLIVVVACACTSTQINQALSGASKAMETTPALSSAEVGDGLKEALIKGVSTGTDQLSSVDGYYKNPQIKIPFPPDVKQVEDKLRQIGLGSEVDKFVTALNRGAEEAAAQAKPIFINAVKQMTIDDAWGILKGSPDAATQYLKRTTSAELKTKFMPVIQNSLDQVNATKYYGNIIASYNKIPFIDKVNPNLNEYATDQAMQGLFTMIAAEEKKIRDNPADRTTELLKKVFGYQK